MKNLILLFFNFLLVASALGQNASQEQLLKENQRPSLERMMSNPSYLEVLQRLDHRERIEAMTRHLPNLIVSLEKGFPGGTYAFLGRDMDLIADAVDAYYLSQGKSGRVVRIPFSTPSLANSNPQLITDFLSQMGLDSKAERNGGPFVIVDFTSYSTQGRNNVQFPSQARYIFQSVITQMKKNKISEETILSKVNVATLDLEASNYLTLSDPLNEDRSTFFQKQAEALRKTGFVDRLTYLPAGGEAMAYYSEWHGKYGPIQNIGGRLVTEPISVGGANPRIDALNHLVLAIKLVQSDDMQSRIQRLAEQHGVDFKAAPVAAQPVKKAKPVDYEKLFKKEIAQSLKDMEVLPAEKQYDKQKNNGAKLKLTENGALVWKVLSAEDAVKAEHYFEISFETLVKLYNENRIGARDFRRIFAEILTLKKIENDAFLSMVRKQYKNILPLEIMLGREGEREKYSSQGGLGEENYQGLIGNGSLKMSCQFAY